MDEPERLPPPPFWRTRYCAFEVMARAERRSITPDMILSVLDQPARRVVQPNSRVRYWRLIRDLDSYLSVITLPDGETVHTYYIDEDFTS
ncbi:MAG TPA: hypothetical protein VKT70_11825 [Stellaceae bacterium]|nr:hypothetical protein [Stellaceae bacterium]